jgi:glycosyltransferase involved in cell wall biosynthesis
MHNLMPHERHPPLGEWLFPLWFPRLCTHVIALTKSGMASALTKYPALRNKSAAVIPHGHYRASYPDAPSRWSCRDRLGLDHRFTFLFLGNIRPYKNVPALIDAFRKLPHPHVQLVIAGQLGHTMHADEIHRRIAGDTRIRWSLEFVPDERVPLYVGAADVVVLPFQRIQNSGSVFLALSFNRAVLAPNLGSLPEMQAQVGTRWLTLYDGPLTTEHLSQAMQAAAIDDGEVCDLSGYDWNEIGQRTLDFYLSRRSTSAEHRHSAGSPAYKA